MNLRPLPASGRCCESPLRLARDLTEYTSLSLVNGRWLDNQSYSHQESSDDPESVRVFCPDCGNYFEVPEEIE